MKNNGLKSLLVCVLALLPLDASYGYEGSEEKSSVEETKTFTLKRSIKHIPQEVSVYGVKATILTDIKIKENGVSNTFFHVFKNYAGYLTDGSRVLCQSVLGDSSDYIRQEDTPDVAQAILDQLKSFEVKPRFMARFIIGVLRFSPSENLPLMPVKHKKFPESLTRAISRGVAAIKEQLDEQQERKRKDRDDNSIEAIRGRYIDAQKARNAKVDELIQKRKAYSPSMYNGIDVSESRWPEHLRWSAIGM